MFSGLRQVCCWFGDHRAQVNMSAWQALFRFRHRAQSRKLFCVQPVHILIVFYYLGSTTVIARSANSNRDNI